MNDAYIQGFLQKCAEADVDPEALVKTAAKNQNKPKRPDYRKMLTESTRKSFGEIPADSDEIQFVRQMIRALAEGQHPDAFAAAHVHPVRDSLVGAGLGALVGLPFAGLVNRGHPSAKALGLASGIGAGVGGLGGLVNALAHRSLAKHLYEDHMIGEMLPAMADSLNQTPAPGGEIDPKVIQAVYDAVNSGLPAEEEPSTPPSITTGQWFRGR